MAEREPIDDLFVAAVRGLPQREPVDPALPLRDGTALTGTVCLELFDAQAASRHVDFAARWLRASGDGFYTIGSAGHEANAMVAAALRPTDPALLHYRSGAFYVARGWSHPSHDPVADMLLGLVAATDEPIAGGRHKVFGHHRLAVIPQTSTIASHLPRAVGLAFAIERARKLEIQTPWPADAVVLCSFGDASVNHSTAVGAINAAGWAAYQGLPLPLLLVCEDNGLGISVPTPAGWVAAAVRGRPGLRYLSADGSDPVATFDTTSAAAEWVRQRRRPALLHLATVRFMAHAGTDVESAYRSPAQISADYPRDPLLGTARTLAETGVASPDEILARYEAIREQVMAAAAQVAGRPRLADAAQVMRPIAADHPDQVAAAATVVAGPEQRATVFGGKPPEAEGPLTLAQAINRTLLDAGAARPGLLVFGEDVAAKGGVYGVTRGLQGRLGAARVFDTLLDEQTILGTALGAGLAGLLPVPEIQYLAYLHNAEDQLRGEAATLQFFSQGRYRNPMVVRVAGYGYQKGFGGHFHNDNAVAVLRDIPGLVVASPARPDDAAAMLRTCLAAAEVDGRVCLFLEPIALYHTRDLHEPGDGGWLAGYPAPEHWAAEHVPVGRARCYRNHPVGRQGADGGGLTSGGGGSGDDAGGVAGVAGVAGGGGGSGGDVGDVGGSGGGGGAGGAGGGADGGAVAGDQGADALTIVTFGNGLYLTLRVARRLEVPVRVVDLRWLVPLPMADVLRHAEATGRVLIVDETRRSGGVGEGVVSGLVDAGFTGRIARVCSADSFVPLGDAAQTVLVSEEQIEAAARRLMATPLSI